VLLAFVWDWLLANASSLDNVALSFLQELSVKNVIPVRKKIFFIAISFVACLSADRINRFCLVARLAETKLYR